MARPAARPQRGRGRHLADWIAELCIETGLTLPQAREHSIAQLQLLAEAAGRVHARRAFIDSQVVFTAVAAAMQKDNQRVLARFQGALESQAA